MFAMVASSTTISWAIEMSTSAHPRRTCFLDALVSVVVVSDMGFLRVVGASLPNGAELVTGAVGRVHRRGQDDLVDDADDRVLGRVLTENEVAVQDDSRERRGEQIEVRVGMELPAVAGALEDEVRRGDLGAEYVATEGRRELLVPADRGQDAGEGGHALLVGESAEPAER